MPSSWPAAFTSSTSRQSDCSCTSDTVKDSGQAGLEGSLPLDDGLVDLGAAVYVVGLGGEQLLQDVGGAIGFERPDLHLTEALSTALRLTTQRLLRDERVRAHRTGGDLVV